MAFSNLVFGAWYLVLGIWYLEFGAWYLVFTAPFTPYILLSLQFVKFN